MQFGRKLNWQIEKENRIELEKRLDREQEEFLLKGLEGSTIKNHEELVKLSKLSNNLYFI